MSNNEEMGKAFLEDIREHPDDDAPRLIYADWLQDHGQPDRAEFIRGQIALASGNERGVPLTSEQRRVISDRCNELLRQHYDEWEKPLHDRGAQSVIFRRGFPEAVRMVGVSQFLRQAENLFAVAPIRELSLDLVRGDRIDQLAASPHLTRLTSLSLESNRIGPEGARALAESPHLTKLTTLNLWGNRIGNAGAQALAASPHLTKLTSLDLAGNRIGLAGVRALAASPRLASLTSLSLGDNDLGNAGVQVLAESPHLTSLRSLDLEYNGIDPEGARALAASPHLTNLTSLSLWSNRIGPEGAQALAASPHLTKLTSLDLASNRIGHEGARALAASPHLTKLTTLNLGGNDIGQSLLAEIKRKLIGNRQPNR